MLISRMSQDKKLTPLHADHPSHAADGDQRANRPCSDGESDRPAWVLGLAVCGRDVVEFGGVKRVGR